MDRKIRILSLDGGGIRGVITAKILVNLNNMLKNKYGTTVAEYFDIVCGTSTGGIITSMLLLKDSDGNPMYTPEDILDLYMNKGGTIFKHRRSYRFKTLFGFFGAKYEVADYEKMLYEYLGDKELKDLSKPSIICTYDTEKRKCILFKQHYAVNDESQNFYLKDVVRATSAAPTYFKPAHIKSKTNEYYTLIDGGIYANNPSMCGFIEVNKIFKKDNGDKYTINDIKILSIGTGGYKEEFKYEKIRKWGIIQWISPIIDLNMSSTSDVTDYQLNKLYEYSNFEDGYLRITADISKETSSMDNLESNNLEHLSLIGDKLFLINKERIKKIIEL